MCAYIRVCMWVCVAGIKMLYKIGGKLVEVGTRRLSVCLLMMQLFVLQGQIWLLQLGYLRRSLQTRVWFDS